ncbi:MAG: hypothetical protein MH204_07470, partial [Fimbriimonadaceae bacterium]|nr:hypothetical protein [Fimbriimonadaceae bacterium]
MVSAVWAVALSAGLLNPEQARLSMGPEVSPVAKVLARIEAETGVRHRADADLASELIFVKIASARAEDLREAVGWAVQGAWGRSGNAFRLEPLTGSPEEFEAMLRIEPVPPRLNRKEMAERLQKAVEENEFPVGLPSERLLKLLVHWVGVGGIASLSHGVPAFFASRPGPFLRPLNATALDLGEWREDIGNLRLAIATLAVEGADEVFQGLPTVEQADRVRSLLLTLRMDRAGPLAASLEFLDEAGRRAAPPEVAAFYGVLPISPEEIELLRRLRSLPADEDLAEPAARM